MGEIEFSDSKLSEVLFVPELKLNLFSVSSATNKGYTVDLTKDKCLIKKDGVVCASGFKENNFYVMNFTKYDQCAVVSLGVRHERLCHQNMDYVKSLLTTHNLSFVDVNQKCMECIKGKAHRLPFKESTRCTSEPLELVHADVCGPLEVTSLGGARYFLLIKDDYSKYRHVYFMEKKSEVFQNVKLFIQSAERETGRLLKVFRSDNGKEFVNKEMEDLFNSKGIQQQTTVPYTPEQNGQAERDMRTLVEAARTMLIAKGLGKELWAEAINTVVYVLNRTSKSRTEGKTPYQVWTERDFEISHLNKIFGTKVWVHIPKEKRRKLDSKAEEGIFVGYDDTKGYRIFYERDRSVQVKRDVFVSSDIKPSVTENTNTNTNEEVVYLDMFDSEKGLEEGSSSEEQDQEGEREGEDQTEEQQELSGIESETSELENSDSPDENEELVRTRSGRTVRKPAWLGDYFGLSVSEGEPAN